MIGKLHIITNIITAIVYKLKFDKRFAVLYFFILISANNLLTLVTLKLMRFRRASEEEGFILYSCKYLVYVEFL